MIDEPLGPAVPGAPIPEASGSSLPPSLTARCFGALFAAAAVAVVLAAVPSRLFDLDRHSVPKELVVHATALLALPWLLRRRRSPGPGVVDALLGLFIVWSGISAVLATNHWISVRAFGLSWSAFLVFLCARRLANEGATGTALRGLGLAAVVGAAIGAAQAYGLQLDWLTSDRPPGGTFGNRNFLAHSVAISAPLLILLAVRTRGRMGRSFWRIGLAVSVCALVLTRSRAGWLGFAAGVAVLGLAWLLTGRVTRAATGRGIRAAALAIVLGGALAVVLPNRLEWRSDSPYSETLTRLTDYRGGSGRGRLIQYRNSVRLVPRSPVFGTGPGNWFVHYPRVTAPGDPAFSGADPIPTNPWPSSDWIALLVERGVPGLLLVLATGGAVLLVSLRRLRSPDPDAALAAAAVPAMLAAVAVTGAFDAVLLLAPPAFFTAVATGLLLPVTRPVTVHQPQGRRRLALGLAMIATSVLVLVFDAMQLAAIRITSESSTRAAITRALRIDPGNYRLRLILAGRGACSARVPHARAAARLLPYHPAPRNTLRACGQGR